VQEFAAYIVNNFEDIHYLVNNAGIHYASTGDALHNISANVTSSQGYDLAFATNYLGHFLLTKLLLPTLQSSGEKSGILSKIIQVSSGVHALSTGETLSTDMKTIPIAASSEHSSKDLSHRYVLLLCTIITLIT
jgi:NAD(P)-dependent dehydrogenase (short-subunit alcohol dehydrogenase family)